MITSLIEKHAYTRDLPKIEFSRQYLKDHPKAISELYWCYVSELNSVTKFTTDQGGYKFATERIPAFEPVCEKCGQPIKLEDYNKEKNK
jgi:hypothetical protein